MTSPASKRPEDGIWHSCSAALAECIHGILRGGDTVFDLQFRCSVYGDGVWLNMPTFYVCVITPATAGDEFEWRWR